MHPSKIIFFLIFTAFQGLYSQSIYMLPEGETSDKIRFELINNVILIPVEVNGILINICTANLRKLLENNSNNTN